MKKTELILLCLFMLLPVKAQITLTGQTFDKTHQEVLPYVSVSIYDRTSSQKEGEWIDASMSDSSGHYQLKVPTPGHYFLKASFVGYKSKQKEIEVTDSPLIQNLPRIALREDEQVIEEVQVIGQTSGVRLDLDKKVFLVEQDITAAGASATDILENIPSVNVDDEGNVSLRNKSNVEIWLNGKPSGVSGSDKGQVLEMIPSESIEKVEVITNPSARYNPEGSVGIINIVLKKNRKAGYYAGVSANLRYNESAPFPGGRIGLNFSYNHPKWEFYIDGSGRANCKQIDGYNHRTTFNEAGDSSFLFQDKTRLNKRYSGFLQTGFTYHISPADELGLHAYGMVGKNIGKSQIYYQNIDGDHHVTHSYTQHIQPEGLNGFYNARLDYLHRFEKDKHEISANISYYGDTQYQQKDYAKTEGKTPFSQFDERQINQGIGHHGSAQLDYFKRWKKAGRLEAGLKADVTVRNSLGQIFREGIWDIPYVDNPFHYLEQIYAVYLSYGNQFDWFGMQLGLRAEETLTEANGIKKDYFELFPSAYFTFLLPKENELQLNYSRRIDRPRGRLINNYVDRSDPQNIRYGNPYLMPEFSNNVELNYLKNWSMHTLSVGLYYSYSNNLIEKVQHLNEKGVMEHTYENISFSHETGVEIMAKDRLFHNYLDLTTSVDLYYYFLGASPEYGIQQQERFSWKARINAKVKIIDQLSAQITAFYRSPHIVSQGVVDHEYGLNLGLNASFLNKALNLSFTVRDVLNSRSHSLKENWGENFYEKSALTSSGRNYLLSLSYNFGNLHPKKNKMRKNIENKMEDELDIDF